MLRRGRPAACRVVTSTCAFRACDALSVPLAATGAAAAAAAAIAAASSPSRAGSPTAAVHAVQRRPDAVDEGKRRGVCHAACDGAAQLPSQCKLG